MGTHPFSSIAIPIRAEIWTGILSKASVIIALSNWQLLKLVPTKSYSLEQCCFQYNEQNCEMLFFHESRALFARSRACGRRC